MEVYADYQGLPNVIKYYVLYTLRILTNSLRAL